MADALIDAHGESLDEVFCQAARALIDTMVEIKNVEEKAVEKFTVQGRDLESLLYNWLEAILIKVSRDGLVFSSFNVKIKKVNEGFTLNGSGKGEKIDLDKHQPKTEVKAVTYHMMNIKEENGQVSARFLLDL